MKRNGDWFVTFTGKQFFPLDPRPEDVDIEDIAHALSMTCRFGGHCREFYSVAQHSVHVAQWLEERGADSRFVLQGLIHDATEAYLGDMIRPLKISIPQYQEIEAHLDKVIHLALEIPVPDELTQEFIKTADNTLLMTERRDFVNHGNRKWSIPNKPWEQKLRSWSPAMGQICFLNTWNEYTS